MTSPLPPPPVHGDPFDLDTDAGRVAGYRLGEGLTVLLLHSFNAAGAGIELAPLALRLAERRRVVVADFRKSPDSISETPQADEPRKGRTSLAA